MTIVSYPQKVGGDYIDNPKKKITYVNISNKDGWVDPNLFIPADHDLVYLSDGFKKIIGWSTGHGWDGLKYNPKFIVKCWKRKHLKNEDEIE